MVMFHQLTHFSSTICWIHHHTNRGDSRIFLMGWHRGGPRSSQGGGGGESCSVAADRWLLVKSSLALSGWLWPVLPGSGLLIFWPTWHCLDWLWHALYCIYLFLTWFLLEETLNVLLLCLTLSHFNFFLQKILSKRKKLTLSSILHK